MNENEIIKLLQKMNSEFETIERNAEKFVDRDWETNT